MMLLIGVICYLLGCGTVALLAAGRAVRDAQHIDWLERDLEAARRVARRLDQERLQLVNRGTR